MDDDVMPPRSAEGVVAADSALIYCFADRFFAPAGRLERDQPTPLGGKRVKRTELAETLFLAAFAGLVRRGKLTITEVERKVLFVKTKRVVVAALAATESEPLSTLEYDVLKAAHAIKDPTVSGVVTAIFTKDVDDPWDEVLLFAKAGMLHSGLAHMGVEKRDGIVGKVAGDRQTFVWSADAIAPLVDQATAAWAAFDAWRSSEPLAAKMRSDIASAIRSRRKREERDDDGDITI